MASGRGLVPFFPVATVSTSEIAVQVVVCALAEDSASSDRTCERAGVVQGSTAAETLAVASEPAFDLGVNSQIPAAFGAAALVPPAATVGSVHIFRGAPASPPR